jgi:predicted nucleic acid-binding protein
MILVDSDILIDALRGREPVLDRLRTELQSFRVATSSISAFELEAGVRSETEQTKVTTLLDALPVVPFDWRAAKAAAKARRDLEETGRSINMADYLIAGLALVHGMPLWTRNRAHFERIPGIVFFE